MSEGLLLSQLLDLPQVLGVDGDCSQRVTGVRSDSRELLPGELFAAVEGAHVDGARFVADALTRGASGVLSQRPLSVPVPVLRCGDVREALGPVAHAVYGHPSRDLPVVAVTGTNGKTTVTYLLETILEQVWGPVALCGTVARRGPASRVAAGLTTPEADTLARFVRDQRDAGARALLMEASSIALAQRRVDGLSLDVAAFTNLSQDHLDFHGDMHAYGAAKQRLFNELEPSHSVISVDDPFGAALPVAAKGQLWRCSSQRAEGVEIGVLHSRVDSEGLRARIRTPAGEFELASPLIGAHNLQNLCVALGVVSALGIPTEEALLALREAPGAPGRMERVIDPRGDVSVFVDYAHTPEAVRSALSALRPLTLGRLWVVVGAGGDRDPAKRAPMGRAAADGADLLVLTSDNPRTEEPSAILAEVRAGAVRAGSVELGRAELPEATAGFVCEVDRARAIEICLSAAQKGDTVLIAGKGHEDYQIIGTTKRPFDDREQARRALQSRRELG